MGKDSIMTTKELAEYIKLNEKTVIKMAQQGKIPGVKIGSQWRFHLETIERYMQNDIVKASDEDLDLVINTGNDVIPVSRLVSENRIVLDSDAVSPEEVLRQLAVIAADTEIAFSQDILFRELKNREKMLSTATGRGVAVPHPRNPSATLFNEPGIIILRSIKGIDFAAPDNAPVHLFFMIGTLHEFAHLRLLAIIAKLMNGQDAFKKIMSAGSKEDVMRILLEFDRENMFSV